MIDPLLVWGEQATQSGDLEDVLAKRVVVAPSKYTRGDFGALIHFHVGFLSDVSFKEPLCCVARPGPSAGVLCASRRPGSRVLANGWVPNSQEQRKFLTHICKVTENLKKSAFKIGGFQPSP